MSTSSPVMAADVVLFSHQRDELHVLLIQRQWPPFAGCWALPGGHVDPGETFAAAARRELTEETGLTAPCRLDQVGVYDHPDRDPRGQVVSVAFTAMLDDQPKPTAGDDAATARWVRVGEVLAEPGRLAFDHHTILTDAVVRAAANTTGVDTRPGGHSAENAHRAGAPNTHQSGETPMVGSADGGLAAGETARLLEWLRYRLSEEMPRFLWTETMYSPIALAQVVTELLTEHTRGLREQRSVLWELLKRSVRDGIDLARQNTAVHLDWFDRHTDLIRLRAGLCAVLDHDTDPDRYPGDDRVIADLRELAAESRQRENDIISMSCEVDKLERAIESAARDSQSAARFVDTMLGGGR